MVKKGIWGDILEAKSPSVALRSTWIQIDTNDEACSPSHKNISETSEENKSILPTSQMLIK